MRGAWWIAGLGLWMMACGGGEGGDTDVVEVFEVVEEAGGPGVTEHGGVYPATATEDQVTALSEVNRVRTVLGLAVVDEDEKLNAAAQAHADFIVANCDRYDDTGLSPHEEDPEWPGFTGVMPWDRTDTFGYQAMGIGEVIAFVNHPKRAVSGWIDTLYHRLPLIDPTAIAVGYGNATGAEGCSWDMLQNVDVMDLGFKGSAEDVVVLYPGDQMTGVARAFDGYESPQPPKPPQGYPSGYIVTVQFGQTKAFSVTGHQILEAGTTALDHTFLAPFADAEHGVMRDPHASAGDSYVALYAHKPLKAETEYRVVIDLIRGDEPVHLEWTFWTR